ncbi:uncharacterized protein L201_002577 [Kwoniella dendrophila CBS 6074]|uniref:Vps72/YL1 C-terminal domain-containing protein n=1 Tax=Kwoniella dendrophila CBS 6074 TaxID=1295534 RepID=A0AAX4JQJ9_9TREE
MSTSLYPLSTNSSLSTVDFQSINSAAQAFHRTSASSEMIFSSSSSSSEYDNVFQTIPMDQMDTSSSTSLSDNMEETLTKKSASAKRRERKKKLIAGEKERAALGIPSIRTFGSSLKVSPTIPTDDTQLLPQTPKAKSFMQSSENQQTPMAINIAGPSTPRSTSPLDTSMLVDTEIVGNEDEDEIEIDGVPDLVRRKTRRGGKKARRRAENRGLANRETSEVDDELFADNDTTSPTSSAKTSRSGSLSNSVDGAAHILDEEDDQSSALESELGTPPNRRSTGGIRNAQDAASSIDSFLSDPRNFMTIKANKLRLWQSLCIELGLVTLAGDELPDLPTIVCVPTPPRPTPSFGNQENENENEDEILTPLGPYIPKKHALPETLTQARKILKDYAHVNLSDYLEARKFCPPAYVGAYQGLLYPSTSAMKRYTRFKGKFVEKELIRSEWLEPLMKDFGVRKAKLGGTA